MDAITMKTKTDKIPASKASIRADDAAHLARILAGRAAAPKLEPLLLRRLKRRRAKLERLLSEAEGRHGIEDGFYRFYHDRQVLFEPLQEVCAPCDTVFVAAKAAAMELDEVEVSSGFPEDLIRGSNKSRHADII